MSEEVLIARALVASRQVTSGRLGPAMLELQVISTIAGDAPGERAWAAAHQVSESARRQVSRLVRGRFGVRDPHRGGLNLLLFPILMAAGIALVHALGVRGLASDTGIPGWLSLAAGTMGIVLIAIGRSRPLSGAFPRALVLATVLLVATTAVVVAGDLPGVVGAVVGAALSVVTTVWVVVMRRRDPAATHAMDTAIPQAYLQTMPVAQQGAERVQRELLAELGADRAAQVVRVREAVLAVLAPDHPKLQGAPSGVPAGAPIVDRLAWEWLPAELRQGAATEGRGRSGAQQHLFDAPGGQGGTDVRRDLVEREGLGDREGEGPG